MAYTARSLDEIFQNLLTYKDSIPELSGLTTDISDEQTLLAKLQSDSVVSKWVLELYIVAYSNWILENQLEQQITEAEEVRDTSFIGNLAWYAFMALQYQEGDVVVVDESTNFVPQYLVTDETKKIVGYCTVEESGTGVLFKLRGRDSDLLTTPQLEGFQSYISKIKAPGVTVLISNTLGDDLKLYANVVYDGQKDASEIKTNVEAAINNYIANIEFNSYFITNKLIDAVQAVDGVIDIEINTLEAKIDGEVNYDTIVHKYKANAGYLKIAADHTLNTTITYQIN